ACHAHGKVPSHGVVTEFKNTQALGAAARRAANEMGYTRMWSIHPDQIRPILEAFAPSAHEIERATKIVAAAAQADWAPISFEGKLEDRASYRYYWQVLERAHQTGRKLPGEAQGWFAGTAHHCHPRRQTHESPSRHPAHRGNARTGIGPGRGTRTITGQ